MRQITANAKYSLFLRDSDAAPSSVVVNDLSRGIRSRTNRTVKTELAPRRRPLIARHQKKKARDSKRHSIRGRDCTEILAHPIFYARY